MTIQKRLSIIISVFLILFMAYGSAIAESVLYYADPTAADQGAAGTRTIKGLATAIGATKQATIVLSHNSSSTNTTYTISTDITLTSNITLRIDKGALAAIATGKTLTINGNFESGLDQAFNCVGTGKVVFSPSSVEKIYPDWWTTNVSPKTTDMTTAVQAAITCALNSDIGEVAINSMMLLTASVNIDRQVNGAAYDEYFYVRGYGGGGFYTKTAIPLFSSSIAFTTAPVTQLVYFDKIYFESSDNTLAAYVLDDAKYLRTVFNGCSFSKIRCLYASTVYTQSIYFFNCNMRRWTGVFFYSDAVSYDIKAQGNLMESGVNAFKNKFAVGNSFIGNTIEGMVGGSAIELIGSQGSIITGNYFEGNTIDIVLNVGDQLGLSIISNYFASSLSTYNIFWDIAENCVSQGNYSAGGSGLHSLTQSSRVIINDYSTVQVTDISPVLTPKFQYMLTSEQPNIAVGSNVKVAFDTSIFDVGGNLASNQFTAPIGGYYQLNLILRLENLDSASATYTINIVTSNRSYQYIIPTASYAADVPIYTVTMSQLADMDAGDVAYVQVNQASGTQQTDISHEESVFSGYLVFQGSY